jgi:signal transduction histidine kinase
VGTGNGTASRAAWPHRRIDVDHNRVSRSPTATISVTAKPQCCGEVIEDLLASAAMKTQTALRDRVDVSAIATAVRDSASAHAEEAGVRLDVEHDSTCPTGDVVVLGSASALRRAITSLVDNALTHQRTGGTITIHVGRHGSNVTVDVRNDGVGIDQHVMGTPFTRFFHRESQTTAAGRRRHGIGLALVRKIPDAHYGEVVVAQKPGGGATFRLTIPAVAPI